MKTSPSSKEPRKPTLSPSQVEQFVQELFLQDLHVKRVLSLANGVLGVLYAAALGIHAIGQGLALAKGLAPKHAIKQVDRLLSNTGIDPAALMGAWVGFLFADRTEAVVALDWTDFAADDHVTCAMNLITSHGRATPLVWKTIAKSELAGHQHQVEDEVIDKLQGLVPRHVRITLLADRGFGDQRRYDYLDAIGWDYVIRFREDILVTDSHGVCKPARQWLSCRGRAKMLRGSK